MTWYEWTTWLDISWHNLKWTCWWPDMTWYDSMTWLDIIWHKLTWLKITWYSDMNWSDMSYMSWCDITWHKMTWHNMVWQISWPNMTWYDRQHSHIEDSAVCTLKQLKKCSVSTCSAECSVYTCTVVSGQCTLSGAREINTAARLTPVVVASVRPVLHL